MLKHIAISSEVFYSNSNIKDEIVAGKYESLPWLKGKNGAWFSISYLEAVIMEEVHHDDYILTSHEKRSILTFSSGERKKALLNYLLQSNPEVLIVENPFDALDSKSVVELKEHLTKLSTTISFVQVFNREEDILPFVENVLVVDANSTRILTVEEFKNSNISQNIFWNKKLPKALHSFENLSEKLIEFKKVSVSYGDKKIVNNINWTIKKGEFWELRGENGSGKTTLLTMINGDNPKAFGQQIYIFGKLKGTGESVWEIKNKIGYFTPAMMDLFNGNHSALNMVVSGLKDSIGLYVQSSNLEVHLAKEWLQLIGLLECQNQKFCNLSETQKRLVLIARAVIKRPPLLILDEPTIGLDDKNALLFAELINVIAKEGVTAILYVSHRKEKGLKPSHVFQLNPTEEGSFGVVS